MKAYIGCKVVHGEPMSEDDFNRRKGMTPDANKEDQPGYLVIYPDGYQSWSPKGVFEHAYRQLNDDEFELIDSAER